MNKLSKTQQEVLNKIISDIEFAKRFNNSKDYYIARECEYAKGTIRYNELIENYTKRYDNYSKETKDIFEQSWLDGLNNIALTRCNSGTLKALQKAGYIEVIEIMNGTCGVDTVRLLKGDFKQC